MNDLVHKIILFLRTYHTEEEIERFYVNQILPHDKRSISEILAEIVLEVRDEKCLKCTWREENI